MQTPSTARKWLNGELSAKIQTVWFRTLAKPISRAVSIIINFLVKRPLNLSRLGGGGDWWYSELGACLWRFPSISKWASELRLRPSRTGYRRWGGSNLSSQCCCYSRLSSFRYCLWKKSLTHTPWSKTLKEVGQLLSPMIFVMMGISCLTWTDYRYLEGP